MGPRIQPTPLQDCARLMRVAAYVLAPSTVVYGLAMVSRNVSPVAMRQTPARKATNAVVADTRSFMHHGVDMRGGDEPEASGRHDQQSGDDAAFVSEFARQKAGRHRHQEVAEVVRELHPGGLGFAEAEFLLEVLVHDVDHAVAESPEEKQRAHQDEYERQVLPVVGYERGPSWLYCSWCCGIDFNRVADYST